MAWAGIILGGGDGKRLRTLTRALTGDDRPKQFCAVVGRETLLEQTRRRARLLIPHERLLTVVTRKHERYFRPALVDAAPGTVVVQPEARGTAIAVLYALLRLEALGSTSAARANTSLANETARRAFARVAPMDLSRRVLAAPSTPLAVLPVSTVRWDDLGQPARVYATRARLRARPMSA